MNTDSATATPSASTSRRVWRGIVAATSVALVGTAALPAAQAEAAGVHGTSYTVVAPAANPASVSPTALPGDGARSITYRVGSDGRLVTA